MARGARRSPLSVFTSGTGRSRGSNCSLYTHTHIERLGPQYTHTHALLIMIVDLCGFFLLNLQEVLCPLVLLLDHPVQLDPKVNRENSNKFSRVYPKSKREREKEREREREREGANKLTGGPRLPCGPGGPLGPMSP